jgi:hypothetical protein
MLRNNSSLQILDLSWNGIAAQGTIQIFEALRKIILLPKKNKKNSRKNKIINFDDNIAINEPLKWNKTLKSLNLSWCGVGNKSMSVAKEVVDTLRQCKYDNSHSCSLTHLNLSNNGLTNGKLKELLIK